MYYLLGVTSGNGEKRGRMTEDQREGGRATEKDERRPPYRRGIVLLEYWGDATRKMRKKPTEVKSLTPR